MTGRTARSQAPAAGSAVALVALAAAIWGTDALFRRGLALDLAAPAVVFFEHLLLAAATLPWLRRIRWGRLDGRQLGALAIIGVGTSAVATAMFTAAFRYGDPNTPLLLQKLQPLIAVVAAHALLGERQHRRFWPLLVAGLAAAYLIAFADPTDLTLESAAAGGLAVGAAALWAMGTVLGRYLTPSLSFKELTAARFAIGLPAAGLLVLIVPTGGEALLPVGSDWVAVAGLAAVPGLAGLLIYYRGLGGTPASAATLAELAFPASALVVNYLAFGDTLTATQALGLVLLVVTLVVLSSLQRSGAPAVEPTEERLAPPVG